MKKIKKKTFEEIMQIKPNILAIVFGIVVGALLGIFLPDQEWVGIFGDIFVGALKAIAPILVFVLVSSALSKKQEGIGRRFRTVIILYMLTTLTAAIIAVVGSYLFPITITLTEGTVENTPPSGLAEVFKTFFTNLVANPIKSMAEGNYIGILFWACVFGVGIKTFGKEPTINMLSDVAEAVSSSVKLVILAAPVGVMGLVFTAVSENGLSIFTEYGQLVLLLVGCMVVSSLIINPIISSILLKRNAYPLVLTCLRESGITAFFTRSSAANIPVNMRLCEDLGIEKEFYSVSIPLGSTINMDGAAITITILTLAVCWTQGIEVNPIMALILCVVSVLGACGASGVAGGSLLLIPMACSLFGISNDVAMQAVAVGFIIGVIQDSVETCLNSSGDVIFTATAEYYDRRKRGEDMRFLGKFAKKKTDNA